MRNSLAMVMIAAATPAYAQWMHQKGEDDPFKGGAEQIAIGVSIGGMTAGFRCSSAKDLTLLLITVERPQPEVTRMLAALPAQMLVIIDSQPKVELSAVIETTPDGRQYRMTSNDPGVSAVLHNGAAAKQRIAIAGQVGTKIIWSQAFGVSGSRRALQPLIDGCKIRL